MTNPNRYGRAPARRKVPRARFSPRTPTYHLGLTATPIYNYGDEMWQIMQFIDDTALGEWGDFEREWCYAIGNGKFRITDPKALGTYLREQYVMIRRLKSDVGQQLPKVSRVVEHVDYDEKAVAAVEDLARALAIKATTASFIDRGNAARELDIMMRQTTGVAKARTVAAFARLMVEAGEAVVLWGWHREVYRNLERRAGRPGTSHVHRQRESGPQRGGQVPISEWGNGPADHVAAERGRRRWVTGQVRHRHLRRAGLVARHPPTMHLAARPRGTAKSRHSVFPGHG